MSVTIELPAEVERRLRAVANDREAAERCDHGGSGYTHDTGACGIGGRTCSTTSSKKTHR